MKLFIDTGSVAEVEELAAWGVLSGATTNPSLLAKEEGDPGESIRRICDLVDGPTSAEVVSDDAAGMVTEGRALRTLHEHIVVKVPFSRAGLAYISCFMGRLDDISIDSAGVVAEIVETIRPGGYAQAQILAASLRHPE